MIHLIISLAMAYYSFLFIGLLMGIVFFLFLELCEACSEGSKGDDDDEFFLEP